MALNSRTYRDGLSGISGLQTVLTIDDLDTLMSDNSAAILDIYSWASNAGNPDDIIEFSSFTYKQLLIKKASGTITIQNTATIQDNTNLTGAASITWGESLSETDLELTVDIAGLSANVFRRATIKMIKA